MRVAIGVFLESLLALVGVSAVVGVGGGLAGATLGAFATAVSGVDVLSTFAIWGAAIAASAMALAGIARWLQEGRL